MDARSSARCQNDDVGLSAFVIRRAAATGDSLELVKGTLAGKGFEALLHLEIDEALRPALQSRVQSATLDALPSDLAAVIFAHDLLPISPDAIQRRDFPDYDNARTLLTLHALGVEFARRYGGKGSEPRAFPLASSSAAWSLLAALAPEKLDSLRVEIARRSADFASGPALRDLSQYSCRARVELIDHHGAKAVRKTFRPGSERFLQRELEVFDQLGPKFDAIPQLIERGPNYFIMEYIDELEQLPMAPGLTVLPLKQVRELADFLKACIANGFDPIDLKPEGNVLYTPGGVKIIDYEFWRHCDPSTPPHESYCLAGLPADYDGDRPWGLLFPFNPYRLKWRRLTGLSRRSFLYDPPWMQRIKRLPWVIRAAGLRNFHAIVSRVRSGKVGFKPPA